MEKFDVLVVGSGSGMIIAASAVGSGVKTALIESGPVGGTCLNRGCVPSKILIHPADVALIIREAGNIGIKSSLDSINFQNIMDRMHRVVTEDVERQTKAIEIDRKLTWFKDVAEFISDYTLKTGDQTVGADKIFIVSGARPAIPPLKGIEDVDCLTSDTVLNLKTLPKSMVIIGGGYIAAEYGHFFSSLGTTVTIVQRNLRMLPEEEPEVSELLTEEMSKRMRILTNHEAVEAKQNGDLKTVVAKSLVDGHVRELSAEALLAAAGRVPNSDLLKPEKTGVEMDKRGYIKVNEYLETRKKNIFAFGDAIGRQMFKHVANYEAQVAWHNSTHDHKVKADYTAAPHAVFTNPQVASVGMKQAEAKRAGYKILVGKAYYKDTAQGAAMAEPKGFVKVIVEKKSGQILGAHIIGPFASMLIQEVINAMSTSDRSFLPIIRGMHIHPAMNEVVLNAFGDLQEPSN
ncbi:MAG TPA: dihydrolipoyl dehydrogenase [Patescibacteria group bacterium]|nr:dihydrolipoyl dehydrogenase [Patescibacteria group bacterium]